MHQNFKIGAVLICLLCFLSGCWKDVVEEVLLCEYTETFENTRLEVSCNNLPDGVYGNFILNPDTAFVTLSFGGILRTTDGGTTWTQTVGSGDGLMFNLSFLNPNIGFAPSLNRATFFKTTDGGASWQQNDLPGNLIFQDLVFTSETVGYGLERSFDIGETRLKVHKTIDGGVSWTELSTFFTFPTTFPKIKFLNPDFGYLFTGLGEVAITKDGGNTWAVQNVTSQSLLNVHFLDEQHAVATTNGAVAVTHDGGATWQTTALTLEEGSSTAFYTNAMLFDANNGVVIEQINLTDLKNRTTHVWRTTDGGSTWQKETLEDVGISYNWSFVPQTRSAASFQFNRSFYLKTL